MRKICVVIAALALVGACGKRDGGSSRPMLQNKGSDTLVNVAGAWAEAYAKVDPNLAIAVSGGGSGTGISALINGTVDIANASRRMKDKEIKAAKANGVEPVEFIVGYDALAVFLHKENTKTDWTIAELADIYGEGAQTTKWSQVDVRMSGCESDKIVVVSRQNNSGTYAYFKKAILGKKRDYRMGTNDLHGSKDVVELVEKTPCAIGYSGLAYATDHVKMARIAKDKNSPYIAPSVKTASDRSYPIARPLLMYTAGEPTGKVKEYLDWILSDEGQRILVKNGYAPVRNVTD